MQFIKTSKLSKPQKQEVFDLWNNEYPEKLKYKDLIDFENYLKNLTKQSHIIMVNKDQKIKGWALNLTRKINYWIVKL